MSATTRQPGAALRRPSAEEEPGPRLFPGDRRVWLLGLALGLLVLGIALVWFATTRETYAGTNSVVVRSVAAQAGSGEALCVPGVDIPDHTGAVRFAVSGEANSDPASI